MTQDLQLDIDLQGVEDVIGDVETFPQSVGHELNVAMEQSLGLLEKSVQARTPKNFGHLRNSIGHQILSPFPNMVGQVSPALPYGIVIEKGRRPSSDPKTTPPVDAIQLWVTRKLGLSGKEARSAAFAIAKSIAKKGFSPRGKVGPTGARMFEKGMEAGEPNVRQLFDAAIARSVARFNQS